MFDRPIKTVVGFRIDPNIWNRFTSIAFGEKGHGGIAFVLQKLISSYIESFDGKEGYNISADKSPPILSDFETITKPFIKSLDMKFNLNNKSKKDEPIFSGPLQDLILNLEDVIIYAKALRARRVMNNMDLETQMRTPMTLEEAYNSILNEGMEEKMFSVIKSHAILETRKGVQNNEK